MQAKTTKTFQVKEPIEKVWSFLSDLRKVGSCLPGAEITEALDDSTYKGAITVKVGPISTQFKGQVKIERLDAQNFEIELSGAGQDPRGGGGASMRMLGKLSPLADGGTEMTATTEITVTGRLAQFGARMMDNVSNHVFEQFAKSFQVRLAAEGGASGVMISAAPSQPIAAIPLALSVMGKAVGQFIGRLFGRSRT